MGERPRFLGGWQSFSVVEYNLALLNEHHNYSFYPLLLRKRWYTVATNKPMKCRRLLVSEDITFFHALQANCFHNGLRLLTAPMPGMRSASIAFFFAVGSR